MGRVRLSPREDSKLNNSLEYNDYLGTESNDNDQGNILISYSTVTYPDQAENIRKLREMIYVVITLEMADLVFQCSGNSLMGNFS